MNLFWGRNRQIIIFNKNERELLTKKQLEYLNSVGNWATRYKISIKPIVFTYQMQAFNKVFGKDAYSKIA